MWFRCYSRAEGLNRQSSTERQVVSQIILRPVVRQDLPDVIGLLRDISPYVPPSRLHDAIWLDFCSQENVVSIVVEVEQIVVGYGVVIIEQKIRGGKVGHIEDIVTRRDHRGRGLGRALMEALVGGAFDLGCYKVTLHCQPHNATFYQKCGFSEAGVSMNRFPPSY